MENKYTPDFHDRREINKMSLQTYHMDVELDFDCSIDKLIEQLKNESEKLWAEHDTWANMEKVNPDKYSALKEEADRMEISLDFQRYEYIDRICFNDDQLKVLAEMKIIYAYKSFEISLKKLLQASFSIDTNPFFRWANVVSLLKGKGIHPDALDSYNNILQLQMVNNVLKHTDELPKSLYSIPEFRKKILTYIELNQFYKRVKSGPKTFIESLAHSIYIVLYEFDDQKIADLANAYVLRMNKDTAHKFAEKLKNNYR